MKLISNAIATEEEANLRYDICRGCENLTFIKTCSQCGCFMKIKTKLRFAACPLNKWTSIEYKDGQWTSDNDDWDSDVYD